jgi:hypothetical protein
VDLCVDCRIAPSSVEDTKRVYSSLLLKFIKIWARSRHYDPEVPWPELETLLPVLLAEGHCEPSTYDPAAITSVASRIRNHPRYMSMLEIQYPTRSNVDETRIHFRDATKRTMIEYTNTVMKGR